MLFAKSNCRNKWLHRFSIIKQFDGGVQERCEICGLKVFFRMINDQSNNKRYIGYHMRQVLPPQHRYFSREYPKTDE